MNDPITPYFAPLIGSPCWGVDKGQGSILFFEFGDPHLLVREPFLSTSSSPAIRKRAAQRTVKPVGAWELMTFGCHWRWLSKEGETARDEPSDEEIYAAVREADGQKLVSVNLNTLRRETTFAFDLGGHLVTWPFEADNDEQWSLYMPDKRVLTYRADGCYSVGPSSQKSGEEVWLKP